MFVFIILFINLNSFKSALSLSWTRDCLEGDEIEFQGHFYMNMTPLLLSQELTKKIEWKGLPSCQNCTHTLLITYMWQLEILLTALESS